MIENVGNLVCPALFDLGEHAKVVIVSVTEGDDKPIKYPHMFRASEVMLLNKIDLLAVRAVRRGPLPGLRPPGQPEAPHPAGLGHPRRRPGRLVRLAARTGGAAEMRRLFATVKNNLVLFAFGIFLAICRRPSPGHPSPLATRRHA